MPKITRTDGTGAPRGGAPEGITASDQAAILKLVDGELKKSAKPPSDEFSTGRGRRLPPTAKYMVHRPGGDGGGPIVAKYMVRPPVGGGGGPIVAKYMVRPPVGGGGSPIVAKYMVRPPVGGGGSPIVAKYMVRPPVGGGGGPIVAKYMVRPPGGGGTPIVAKYMVVRPPEGGGTGRITPKYMAVPPDVVAMYMVVPPWAGVDAHQAVINKVTSDGKLSKKEGHLLRKLFNRDIKEAAAVDKDIRPSVASYLHKVLDKLDMDKTTKNLVFGPGGPGFTRPPIAAKYMIRGPNP